MNTAKTVEDAFLEESMEGFVKGINMADLNAETGLSLSMEQLRIIRKHYLKSKARNEFLEERNKQLQIEVNNLNSKLFKNASQNLAKSSQTRLDCYI